MQYFEEKLEVGGRSVSLVGYLPIENRKSERYTRLRPAVIVLPGGGYLNLADHEGEPVALRFAAEGVASFVLYYSTAKSEAVFPQALAETLTAVRLLRERAEEYGIDRENIAVLGFSAGGHLAASAGTLWGHPCLDGLLEGERRAFRPDKILPCYPVISADPAFYHKWSFQYLFGKPFEALTEEELSLASLERCVTSDTAPAFLWTTFEDTGVPPLNAVVFAEALLRKGVACELHLYPHGPHGTGLADHLGTNCAFGEGLEAAAWCRDAIRFLYDKRIR